MNNLQEKVIRAMVDMYGFYSIEELSEMTEISISSIKRSLKDITKFIEDNITQCEDNVEYYRKTMNAEYERTQEKQDWMDKFLASLENI